MDWLSVGCCLLAFLLYYNTLDAGFVYDDRRAVITNPDVTGQTSLRHLLQNDFWGTPLTDGGSHGSYRPLCVATYRLNYALSGLRPWSYHLLNVLLHCLATALVVRVARRLLPPSPARVGPAVAGLAFAAHPVHTEAVAGVVGRADLAACNLFLLSFLAYAEHVRLRDAPRDRSLPRSLPPRRADIVRRRCRLTASEDGGSEEGTFRLSCHGLVQQLAASLRRLVKAGGAGPLRLLGGAAPCEPAPPRAPPPACRLRCCDSEGECDWRQWAALGASLLLAAAATLCKEPGITVLPVCVIYDFVRGAQDGKWNSKGRMCSAGATFAGCAALLCWRLQLGGGAPSFAAADNPAARDPSILARFFTFAYLPVFNFLLLLWPNNLSFDWSMDAVPRVHGLFDVRNLAAVLFYAVLSRVTWRASCAVFGGHRKAPIQQKDYRDYRARQKRAHRSYYHYTNAYGSRTSHRNGYDNPERRSYYAPYREERAQLHNMLSYVKKTPCPCAGCRHTLTDDHTSACRAVNNNNAMTHLSVCACPPVEREVRVPRPHARVLERRSPQAALLIALAFLALPFLPASNAFFYVGFVVAERVLYVPSVGYCLLLGVGAGAVWRRARGRGRGWAALVAVLLAALCARTLRRNLDWRDEESLFRSAVHINPPRGIGCSSSNRRSCRQAVADADAEAAAAAAAIVVVASAVAMTAAYGNLGSVLSSQGRAIEAEQAYRRALLHRPNMADVHYNLGILLQSEKRYEEAIKSFERAIFYRPSMALAYVNLGVSLVANGQVAEAASVLRAGARADGSRVRDRRAHDTARVSALVQLAALHSQRAHWHKALAAYHEALDAMPPDHEPQIGWSRHSILTLVADVHTQLSQWEEAERATRAAVAAAPAHAPVHLSYAKLLARNSTRALEAEKWFKRALYLAPHDPNARHQFGEFLSSQRRAGEAAEQFVRAAQLAPDESVRAAVAARALRDAARCDAAELWYARAAHLNPQDAESHSNLGAILHLNGKYSQAAASYRRALKLLPGDSTALTNLRRVRTLMADAARRNSERHL